MSRLDLLLWLARLVELPARLRRAWIARQHAAYLETMRALTLRNRVVEDLARAMGAAELSGRADLGPTGDGVWRVAVARVRTVADVRELARPWRSWLSPALRAELWPDEERSS